MTTRPQSEARAHRADSARWRITCANSKRSIGPGYSACKTVPPEATGAEMRAEIDATGRAPVLSATDQWRDTDSHQVFGPVGVPRGAIPPSGATRQRDSGKGCTRFTVLGWGYGGLALVILTVLIMSQRE